MVELSSTCVSQAPGSMYCRICVISDLLPSEWPPVQVRKGVPHPLPTHKEYRVALVKGLVPLMQDFLNMVATAVASDSRMFRAALVRLVARAAGLQTLHYHCLLGLVHPMSDLLGVCPHPGYVVWRPIFDMFSV